MPLKSEKESLAQGFMPKRITRTGYLSHLPYRAQIEVVREKQPEKVLEYGSDPKAPAIEVDQQKQTQNT